MKILHWKDSKGRTGHGEPIKDDICDEWVRYSNKEHDDIYHWYEPDDDSNKSKTVLIDENGLLADSDEGEE